MTSFEDAADRSPVHLHLLGVAQLLAGQPFLAGRTLMSALAKDPSLRAAHVDLAAALVHTERLGLALTCLINVIDRTTVRAVPSLAAVQGADAFPYPHDSPQAVRSYSRLCDVNALIKRRSDEFRFLTLRTADDAQARSHSPVLRAREVLRHTTALIALGELTDALLPFDQAAELLMPGQIGHQQFGSLIERLDGAELEQLARIGVAAGPRSTRDELLKRLQRRAPQSRVLAERHQPTMLERRFQEQEAHIEARVLAMELAGDTGGWTDIRRPIEQLRRRARASDFPEPYQVALLEAGDDPNKGDWLAS
ncbi:hypothetical protein ABZ890_41975 [Streptomyces sp. NPDC046984]|uniref:hypothetical protein n=1 Tax=Streptomyces sp. NPDC046984 TaxID=3155138 RepID=UPI00340A5778